MFTAGAQGVYTRLRPRTVTFMTWTLDMARVRQNKKVFKSMLCLNALPGSKPKPLIG